MFKTDSFEIPSSVEIENTKKGTITPYRVLWIDNFKDPKQIGECDYDLHQIVIKKGMDKWTTFWTFFHELEHAISEENNLKVSERQVNGLEIGFAKVAIHNGWGSPEPKMKLKKRRVTKPRT